MSPTEFKKGNKPGPGRPPGTPNKVTAELKDMILGALAGAGGIAYLQDKAESHPAAFLALVGKVLPMQVTGANGNPIQILLGQLGKTSLGVTDDDPA
jgi:hypothetical protein